MEFLNYYIADMDPAPSLSPAMVWEACQALKRNREQHLRHYPTSQLIHLISEAAHRWRQKDNPIRHLALEKGPAATGFSSSILEEGLDVFFKAITPDALEALIQQDLGHIDRLDQFASSEPEQLTRRSSLATAPCLLTHITAGNLPCPTLMSILLGLLIKSAQFVKCGSGTSFIPRLLAHTIHEIDPKAASCLEIVEWPGGQRPDLEEVLFQQTDRMTATGSDETLQSLRNRLPKDVAWLGYGHKVSFALVARESLVSYQVPDLVSRLVDDLTAWDQLGCLSPHAVYLEAGGSVTPREFAAKLAQALEQRENSHPRGKVSVEMAATIRSKRDFYEIRAQHSEDTRIWQSKNSTAWTVVSEENPLFQVSCLHRFIYVKPVQNLEELVQQCDAIRKSTSTVGLAAPARRAKELAQELAQWGASRVCPLGQMQRPPITWRHDGRLALSDLVQWTDWEMDTP